MSHGTTEIRHGIIHERRENWHTYREHASERHAIYNGNYLHILLNLVSRLVGPKTWQRWKDARFWTEIENVSADVIGKTVKVYKRGGYRAFESTVDVEQATDIVEGEEPEEPVTELIQDPVYEAILQNNLDFDYEHEMDRALKLAEAGVAPFIRPFVFEESPDMLQFQIVTAEFVEAVDVDLHDRLTGIEYVLTNPEAGTDKDDTQQRYIFDSRGDGEFMKQRSGGMAREPGLLVLDENGRRDEELTRLGAEYPYRREDGGVLLPFVPVRRNPEPGFLFNQQVGEDLRWATLAAAWYASQVEWLTRLQSHKQYVVTATNIDAVLHDQFMDPSAPIFLNKIEDETKIEVFDVRTDPAVVQQRITDLYERGLNRRGVSKDAFQETAQRMTAQAQRISREGEQDHQLELIRDMRRVEIDFMKISRVIWNFHNPGEQISMDARAVWDPADPYESDPWANFPEKKEAIELGVYDPIDFMMDLDKDLSRADAEKQYERNRKNKGRIRVSFGAGQAQEEVAAATTPPPVPGAAPEIPEITREPLPQEIR